PSHVYACSILMLFLLCCVLLTLSVRINHLFYFFFFTAPATTEIYTLSLHDALPISRSPAGRCARRDGWGGRRRDAAGQRTRERTDRKSTRLNSSHVKISYAVFCLKKKKKCY